MHEYKEYVSSSFFSWGNTVETQTELKNAE